MVNKNYLRPQIKLVSFISSYFLSAIQFQTSENHLLPEFVSKVLHKIATDTGFIDYTFDYKPGTNFGDNFLGILVAVTINGTRRHDNGPTADDALHLMVKIPPHDPLMRERFLCDAVFDREFLIYGTFLPMLTAFQRDKGFSDAEIFASFPKVYACEHNADHDTHILVMENLRARNFDMWPKIQPIRLDHELLLMEALGRLHGLSFALKDQRPADFEQFKRLDDLMAKMFNGVAAVTGLFEDQSELATRSLANPEHRRLVSAEKALAAMNKTTAWEARDRFGVVAHGDCWNNNYMFQYGRVGVPMDRGSVRAVAIVDWQHSRYTSPALDLLYHIFAMTDKRLRDDHFETLLRTYHGALGDVVRRLGSDPDRLFSYDDLRGELRAMGDYALFTAPMIIQVRLKNAPDQVESKPEEGKYVCVFGDETQRLYARLLSDAIGDLIEYGFVRLEEH